MTKRIVSVSFIYFCCCVAWLILGGTVSDRTRSQNRDMRQEVGRLWGGEQVQTAPTFARVETVRERVTRAAEPTPQPEPAYTDRQPSGITNGAETVSAPPSRATETVVATREDRQPVALAGSTVAADVALEHRRKGLLWYPTYGVTFGGRYRLANETEEAGTYAFRFQLPSEAAVFGDVRLTLDGEPVDAAVESGMIEHVLDLEPGQTADLRIRYRSQGTGAWRYDLIPGSSTRSPQASPGVATIRDFDLTMTTDFADVDFPPGSLSPTAKSRRDGGGWTLRWDMGTLVTDATIGLAMPQKLNPGPWVSRVTFFAPVSLFLFFFVVFVMTLLRGVRLHPMHYFFLGASFFAFHLLLAYLVDHVEVGAAMALASVVSLGLVVSYMRLVAGLRFALVEVGGAQLVYLVGFASTFFLEGFTGLSVTLLSIATLFVVMQATGHVDWESLLARPDQDETTDRLRARPTVAAAQPAVAAE